MIFIHRLNEERILLRERCGGVIKTCLRGGHIQVGGFYFPGKLLAQRRFHLLHLDAENLRDHAHINHVLDQLAQLGLGTHGSNDLVVRNGVEDQVRAQRIELQRLVVNDRSPRRQRHHVFLRRLRIHRHQHVNLFFAGDVAMLAATDGVPGWEPRDIRRKKVLSGNGNSHAKQAAKKNGVRRLRTRPVDGGYLNAEVIDDSITLRTLCNVLNG